jgi:glutathione S-transferase
VTARAIARSVSNEMHADFGALRNACPMNLRRQQKPVPLGEQAMKDVARIEHIWRDCRARFGKGGKFLFGRFSIADAMYAPVVTRFDTYLVTVADDTRAYMDTIMNTEAFLSWREAALKESWIVPSDEVD